MAGNNIPQQNQTEPRLSGHKTSQQHTTQQKTTKEAFLQRISEKLQRDHLPSQVERPIYHQHPWDKTISSYTEENKVSRFIEALEALGGEVIQTSQANLEDALSEWLSSRSISKAVLWDHPAESFSILKQVLEGHPAINTTLWNDETSQQELIAAAEQAEVGFTFASYGLSETGSVVLLNGQSKGRLVSLLPNISVTFLEVDRLVPRITQVLQQVKGEIIDLSCINIITGPSRSADIEMDLSKGVHGPSEKVVFLIRR
jgi:L-lactate dehydrogenase complex protein LldG